MAARRIPLAQVHNAVNSPRRPAAPTTKRPRSALEQKEDYGNSPVKKRHIIDLTEDGHRRPHVSQIDEPAARLHNNATTRGIPNVLTRKLAAYRQPKVEEKQEKATRTDEDTIRQWRRHYRKLFPQFVFYLESIPEDISQKMSRQIQALGAVRVFVADLCSHADILNSDKRGSSQDRLPMLSPLDQYLPILTRQPPFLVSELRCSHNSINHEQLIRRYSINMRYLTQALHNKREEFQKTRHQGAPKCVLFHAYIDLTLTRV